MSEKIALFSPSLVAGGSERVMLNLARGFVEQGYPVDLVLCCAEGEYLGELEERVRLVDLGARRVATSLPALIKYLRSEKPSAMLSTQGHTNVIALIAATFPGIKTRLIVRDTESPVGANSRKQTIWMRFIGFLARFFYSNADAVVAVCGELKQQIADNRSVPLDKIAIIYNPVQVEDVIQKAKKPAGHDWLDDSTTKVILSIGRLEEEKNFTSLIRAFALVRRKFDVKLVILGEGALRADLTELTESLSLGNDIDLPGFVSNPYSYIARANVFVLSSLWEGLPNVLLESLTLGTPIVATDCETGPREILRGGKDGILVPVRDLEALAEGIVTSLRTSKRAPPAPESLKRFEFQHVIDQYLEILCPNK